jgi:hypothetical protein
MADEDDLSDLLGPEPVEDPDLADLLGPPPSRALQKESRKQALGPSRLTATAIGMGSGRVPGGKCSPERMRRILSFMEDMPIVAKACRFVNIHPATLQLWLTKSERGQPGDIFDIVINPDDPEEERIVKRFHELYDFSLESGVDNVEEAAMKRAIGYEEVLTYQGHVMYRLDPVLVDLGYTGSDAWLKDPRTGRPVPEVVLKQDPDLIQFILKNRRAKIYGNKQQIDVSVRGGVLVVAAKALTGEELNAEETRYKETPMEVTFDDEDIGDVGS